MEVIEIFGKISYVKQASDENSYILKIDLLTAKETRVAISRYLIPYETDDTIYCVCKYSTIDGNEKKEDSKKILNILKHPLVKVSKDKHTSLKTIMPFLKERSEEYYEYTKNGKTDVIAFDELTKCAINYNRDGIHINPESYFDSKEWVKFLNYWYKCKVIRQLELIGVTEDEFKYFRMEDSMGFVDACLENPYKVYTIPIEKADNISNIIGHKADSATRLCGTIVRQLYDFVRVKCWVGIQNNFIREKYEITDELMTKLEREFDVVVELETMYLKYYNSVEKELTTKLIPSETETFEYTLIPTLSNDQKEALDFVMREKISLIHGSAGTGKTTITKELVRLFKANGINYLLLSFTGKAVSRIKQVLGSGDNVMTIHRAIAQANDLPRFCYLIIDEVSMVSNDLLYMFFKEFSPMKIIMIGDPNQLPPIDWGDLVGQVLKSVPNYKLTTQHRQGVGDLTDLFRKILDREEVTESTEHFTMTTGKYEKVVEIVKDLKRHGVVPEDFVVITFLNKDVNELNPLIQRIYDEGNPKVTDNTGRVFMIGDKVMLTKNNYEIDVYNGEEGTVVGVDRFFIIVKFGERKFNFYLENKRKDRTILLVDILVHSYCITVHRSQGSEWKNVIFYIDKMGLYLSNNIVYTALSRAKNKIYYVGDTDVLNKSINTNKQPRLDNLAKRINIIKDSEGSKNVGTIQSGNLLLDS